MNFGILLFLRFFFSPADSTDFLGFVTSGARHEKYNGRIKWFNSMKTIFRHGKDLHEQCFRSICVLCEYEIPGNPLFDVLIEYVTAEESDEEEDSSSESSGLFSDYADESASTASSQIPSDDSDESVG